MIPGCKNTKKKNKNGENKFYEIFNGWSKKNSFSLIWMRWRMKLKSKKLISAQSVEHSEYCIEVLWQAKTKSNNKIKHTNSVFAVHKTNISKRKIISFVSGFIPEIRIINSYIIVLFYLLFVCSSFVFFCGNQNWFHPNSVCVTNDLQQSKNKLWFCSPFVSCLSKSEVVLWNKFVRSTHKHTYSANAKRLFKWNFNY